LIANRKLKTEMMTKRRWVKWTNDYYDLPVILCSAYSIFKHDIKSIPANYYVVKGADLRDLKAKVEMALGEEMLH
jgi:hypothetical protein